MSALLVWSPSEFRSGRACRFLTVRSLESLAVLFAMLFAVLFAVLFAMLFAVLIAVLIAGRCSRL